MVWRRKVINKDGSTFAEMPLFFKLEEGGHK
jgi:hypothetical protein